MKSGAEIMLPYEDRILWEKVARSVKPLKGRVLPELAAVQTQSMDGLLVDMALAKEAVISTPIKTVKSPVPVRLDEPTHRKIAKGKLNLSARIDLHGLNQARAHGLLLAFLQRAHNEGLRHILIITGKGTSMGSDGVLRQAVPHWFATPAFRPYVSAYEDAARHHGGAGALYVRLKRRTLANKP